jgi:cycloartenol synthase
MAFIPMSYLYGMKFVGPITELVLSLREELHIHPYKKINWKQARSLCAKVSWPTIHILPFAKKHTPSDP